MNTDAHSDAQLSSAIGRYAVMAAFTELIPVPFLDSWCQAIVLRGMIEELAKARGVTLEDPARRTIVDPPRIGCFGLFFAVIWWGVKKLVRTILIVLEGKYMVDTGVRAWHVGLLLDHLMETGRMTGKQDPAAIRRALDRTLAAVEIRPIERGIRGKFRGAAKMATRAAVTEATAGKLRDPQTRAERLLASAWAAPETVAWIEQELA